MSVQLSQFPHPLTSLSLVAAVYAKFTERALQSFVGENVKIDIVASWTGLFIRLYVLDTRLAKASAKAGQLMRFAEYQQTNGTLTLESALRPFDEPAVVSATMWLPDNLHSLFFSSTI